MSLANPLWGAPRIHGELPKLGLEVAQSTVTKSMARGRRPPDQSWKIFLRNHAAGIAAMNLLMVPTIDFRLRYGFVILQHDRRRIITVAVTSHPTAEWIARQSSIIAATLSVAWLCRRWRLDNLSARRNKSWRRLIITSSNKNWTEAARRNASAGARGLAAKGREELQ
jgi:hypothetical protein